MLKTKHLGNLVLIGSLSTTLFIMPILMDPIGLPKLFILSFFYGFILLILFKERRNLFSPETKFIVITLLVYMLLSFLSGLMDSQRPYQILMGEWGRNNGFLQVLFLAVLFLGSVMSTGVEFYKKIIQFLFVLGIFFSSYAWLQFFGRDPVTAILPWYEKDQPIILTLGNSNFSSIFLALTFTATVVILVKSDNSKIIRIISSLTLISHFLLIRRIDTQGKISFAVSFAIMGFVYLFFNKNELLKRISFIWGFGALLSGVLGITALFGIGPFAYVLSDNVRALTDRFYAWLAAIKMIKDNPLYGVGIDNFVDSYRLYRYPEAYEIQTNQPFIDYDNAHNIFLNIGATSGVPTLLAYLGIIIAVTYRGILSLKYHQEKIVVGGLFSIWCIYLINSLVSIDSLGLSVWGWISGGALVSMSMNKNMSNPVTDHNSRTYSIKQRVLVVFIVIISCLPSLYIIPSLINENKLYKYISNIPKLNSKLEAQANLNALFMEAKNTKQIGLMLVAIDYLGYANFLNESQELSKIAVKEFPNSFWAWEFLARSYEIQGDDVSAIPARQKTIELDPLNMIIRQKIVS